MKTSRRKHISCNPNLDINKTSQQKARRKKHRPKVVSEAKHKQTLSQRTLKPIDANKTPNLKRKFGDVNKVGIPSTTPLQKGAVTTSLDCKIPASTVKTCRKALNFELEDQVKEKNKEVHDIYFPKNHKKRRMEKVLQPNTSQILSFTIALARIRGAIISKNHPRKAHEIYFPEIHKKRRTKMVLKQNTSHVLSFTIALARIRARTNSHIYPRETHVTCFPEIHKKRRTKKVKTFNTYCLEAHPNVSNANRDRSKSGKKNSAAKTGKPKGPFLALPWIKTNATIIDAIIEGMMKLSISRAGSLVEYQEQSSLLPYHVQNQEIISFERPQSSKKRERAKVDLDDKTNRVWNLLPEDINNQGIDRMDEKKTKCWEEEHNLFRRRVNSFIRHMRCVQGNRSFSPWKGSVVDSVIGVFLTQNVSDHLSSSAYMSLVARYPLKSENKVTSDFVELDHNNDNLILNEKTVEGHICNTEDSKTLNDNCCSGEAHKGFKQNASKKKTRKNPEKASYEWDDLRKQAQSNGSSIRQGADNTLDSLDWEAIRCANVDEIAETIRERGMNNMLAERIKGFLDKLVNDHGSFDLEWLRDVPPDKAKEYLLSIRGLGLKSVECVRLLTLHHPAFPVDTNVGRIAVRLGWVPLQTLPESLQLHLLELYPILDSIQKYLWPRLCKLDQNTLYELHYHMITFGKVFCTKRQPNCNACPLRGECRHFASALASTRLALPRPQDRSIILSDQRILSHKDPQVTINSLPPPLPMANQALETKSYVRNYEPIVEIPAPPIQEPEYIQTLECEIEDAFSQNPNEIPTIKLNREEFTQTLQAYKQSNEELQEGDRSRALVALATSAACIPTPKLKNVSQLRTEHHVYELPDMHCLLRGLDKVELNDPFPYLLVIWSPGETASSAKPPERRCNFQEPGQLCNDETCLNCNSQREANLQIVRGTLLVKTHIN